MEDYPAVLTRSDAERLVQAVIDHVLGLGPLEPLLADPTITEIMVNDPTHVFIEREGRMNRALFDSAMRPTCAM